MPISSGCVTPRSCDGEAMANVLVTGASGFLGTAVIARLLTAGHYTVGLDLAQASDAAMTQSSQLMVIAGVLPSMAGLPNPEVLRLWECASRL
jgi:NAD(P)-dependent dehydrogenase (short-subunit alcohol dehydrogenase family)